ncbi:MAG: 1-acyl-sn-glycerol-3-phosphate acyltransferase [Aquificaceae bacterium]|nr:MAG: 1-acyl-sn-glycerol-3-phosphate acyltransferase [Aquificaceae bacterium]
MSGRCSLRPFGRFVLKPLWFFLVAPLFRKVFKIKAYGSEVLERKGPLIIAPNHRSYIDPPLIASLSPEPLFFLAKRELFEGRLKNWLFRNMNAIPVDRSKADFNALNEAVAKLKEGCKVCIFPEGRRAPERGFLKPKPGIGYLVAKTKVPVVPVYIHNSTDILSSDNKHFRIPQREVIVIFGKPIEFKNVEDSPRGYKEVANLVMEEIKKLSNKVEDYL